ncbi:MAG: response regulator transcription factor [Actinobacteria bacterium]|nr:MAG: response regulator transcription factor [Actinomycetota bacterium]
MSFSVSLAIAPHDRPRGEGLSERGPLLRRSLRRKAHAQHSARSRRHTGRMTGLAFDHFDGSFHCAMTKLVIIDDHEALREGLAALLGHGGMEVVGAAGNVAAGVDLVEHTHPDVAIVDIRLPDGSGIDLTRELLARRPDLGVILYTSIQARVATR